MANIAVDRRQVKDEAGVFDGDGRRRGGAFGLNADGVIGDGDGAGGQGALTAAAMELGVLIQHGETAGGVEFLDLVPGEREIAENVGVEDDFALHSADKVAVEGVSVGEHERIWRGRRGRFCIRRREGGGQQQCSEWKKRDSSQGWGSFQGDGRIDSEKGARLQPILSDIDTPFKTALRSVSRIEGKLQGFFQDSRAGAAILRACPTKTNMHAGRLSPTALA